MNKPFDGLDLTQPVQYEQAIDEPLESMMSDSISTELPDQPISDRKLIGLEKTSRIMRFGLLLGLLLMVSACFHGSAVWAFFCVLTGWIGVVIGLLGGGGWAAHLLGRIPIDQRVSKTQGILWSLFTFWIPTLAAAVFGMGLASVLPDQHRPGGPNLNNVRVMFESLAM